MTALCLRFNPANYTIWWYRRKCLSALSKQDDTLNNNNSNNDGDNEANNAPRDTFIDNAQEDNDQTVNSKTSEETNMDSIKHETATYYNIERIKLDLELASDLGGSNPKNYQIWYHRRSLLEYQFENLKDEDINNNDGKSKTSELKGGGSINDDQDKIDHDNDEDNDEDNDGSNGIKVAKDELEYIASVLGEDAKNYHVSSISFNKYHDLH